MAEFNIKLGAANGRPAHQQLIDKDGQSVPGTDFRLKLPGKIWGRVVGSNAPGAKPLFLNTGSGWEVACWLAPGSMFNYPATLASNVVLNRTGADGTGGGVLAWHYDSQFEASRSTVVGDIILPLGQTDNLLAGWTFPTGIIDYWFIRQYILGDRQVKSAALVVTYSAGLLASYDRRNSRDQLMEGIDFDLLEADIRIHLRRMTRYSEGYRLVLLDNTPPSKNYAIAEMTPVSSSDIIASGSVFRGVKNALLYSESVTARLNAIQVGDPRTTGDAGGIVTDDDPQRQGFTAEIQIPEDPVSRPAPNEPVPKRFWIIRAPVNFELRVIL